MQLLINLNNFKIILLKKLENNQNTDSYHRKVVDAAAAETTGKYICGVFMIWF